MTRRRALTLALLLLAAGPVLADASGGNAFATTSNDVAVGDLAATGTPGATTFLRGDGTWATPAGTGASLSANNTFTGTNTFAGVVLGSATVVNAYTASFGAVTAASTSTVTWTETKDRLGEFVTSSTTFLNAGDYQVTVNAGASQTAGTGCLLLKVNGTTVPGGTNCATGGTALATVIPVSITYVITAAANDILRVDASATTANVTFTNASLTVTRLP